MFRLIRVRFLSFRMRVFVVRRVFLCVLVIRLLMLRLLLRHVCAVVCVRV